jgi:uncharacterized protein (TIGR00251 family)
VIRQVPGGVLLTVHVIPRAARSVLAGTRAGALLVRLAAAPVGNSANEALIELLASVCGVARRLVTIESGTRSRRKQVRIDGVLPGDAAARLGLTG